MGSISKSFCPKAFLSLGLAAALCAAAPSAYALDADTTTEQASVTSQDAASGTKAANASAVSDYTALASTNSLVDNVKVYSPILGSDSSGIYMLESLYVSDKAISEGQECSPQAYRLLQYDSASDNWSVLIDADAGSWIEVFGEQDTAEFGAYIQNSFTINDQIYWVVYRDDKDQTFETTNTTVTVGSYVIVTFDKDANALKMVREITDTTKVFAVGNDVYYTKADCYASTDVVKNWISNGYRDEEYLFFYKYDILSDQNQDELVCGLSLNFDMPQEEEGYDYVESADSHLYIVGDYLCVTLPFKERGEVAVANLATLDTSQPLTFTYCPSNFVFNTTTSFTVADNKLVCAAVQRAENYNSDTTDSTPSYTIIFDPSTEQFSDTQVVLSGGVPTYTNAILDGSTLYVWGVEYNAQGDKEEFFRSLSLAQWLGNESVADLEPDAVVAPSAINAEGEAVASELADTSDKTNALALEAALALSLATCAAAATQIQRRRKKM